MVKKRIDQKLRLRNFDARHGRIVRGSGKKPHLTNNAKRIDCHKNNYAPFVVPGLSTSSSTTPTPAPSSSSQDSLFDASRYTENPVSEKVEVRVRSYGETRCINQQKPKAKIKMKDAKKYKAIYYMTCRTGCRSSERQFGR